MGIGDLSVPLALLGVSLMLILAPAQTLALEALSGEALNKATSLVNAAKTLWGSIGSAALVTVYIQHARDHAVQLAAALPAAARTQPASAQAVAARAATSGMVDVFTLLLWGALALAAVALFLPGRRVVNAAEQDPAPVSINEHAAST